MLSRLFRAAALIAATLVAPVSAQAQCLGTQPFVEGYYMNGSAGPQSIHSLDLRFVCGAQMRRGGDGFTGPILGSDPHWNIRLWEVRRPVHHDWGATRGDYISTRGRIVGTYDHPNQARRTVTITPDGPRHVRLTMRSVAYHTNRVTTTEYRLQRM
jgi:hypothetical protein